jgi:hypothetical protein
MGHYPDEDPENQFVPYALKVYSKSALQKEVGNSEIGDLSVCKEIDRLRKVELPLWGRLKHPNIVTAFSLFEDLNEDKMYLWM